MKPVQLQTWLNRIFWSHGSLGSLCLLISLRALSISIGMRILLGVSLLYLIGRGYQLLYQHIWLSRIQFVRFLMRSKPTSNQRQWIHFLKLKQLLTWWITFLIEGTWLAPFIWQYQTKHISAFYTVLFLVVTLYTIQLLKNQKESMGESLRFLTDLKNECEGIS